jgi:diguanylate cyclase (GGDEF)-like protein
MSAFDQKGKPRGTGRPRTQPIEDAGGLRDALLAELQKSFQPYLVVVSGPDVGKRARLERGVEIGRDPVAGFPVSDDTVSWRHFRVEDHGAGEWTLVDLGSTNGTRVNGSRATDIALKPGDRIFVGKTILEFQEHDGIQQGFNAEVERLLSIDDLSGLWVRRRFDVELSATVAAVHSGTLPIVSVIVMDLDGVKAINDTHGHEMGAFVIGEAGHVIGATLGARGFATRFGGDEYAAALPSTGKPDALLVAEALRLAVNEHVYEKEGVRVQPGLSCGVAALPEDAADATSVFRAADQAMYRAKRAGKNRVST